jgi:hypothetical protein
VAFKWLSWLVNDGGRLPGIEWDHWFKLAIYRAMGCRDEYVASIEFYGHPSKEPGQSVKKLKNLVEVALFFITYDPLVVLKNNFCHLKSIEMRDLYDVQLAELLLVLDKTASIYRRPRLPQT